MDSGMAHGGNKGLTLVEVVIALGLFLVGALAVTRMFGVSDQAIRASTARTQAVLLGRERMESLKGLSYSDLADGAGVEEKVGQEGNAGTSYRISWTVEKDRHLHGLASVAVRVRWRSAGMERNEVHLATLRTDLSGG